MWGLRGKTEGAAIFCHPPVSQSESHAVTLATRSCIVNDDFKNRGCIFSRCILI